MPCDDNFTCSVEVDKHGVNVAIKAHPLDDATMRKLGFTDHRPDWWYFGRHVASPDTSFILEIKKDGTDRDILVFDENFGQSYDYQAILARNPNLEYALQVKREVENFMQKFTDAGIISGWSRGDYI